MLVFPSKGSLARIDTNEIPTEFVGVHVRPWILQDIRNSPERWFLQAFRAVSSIFGYKDGAMDGIQKHVKYTDFIEWLVIKHCYLPAILPAKKFLSARSLLSFTSKFSPRSDWRSIQRPLTRCQLGMFQLVEKGNILLKHTNSVHSVSLFDWRSGFYL